MAVFISLHLFNHLASISSAGDHIRIMDMLRVVYRSRVGETILLAACGVQIVSGIRLLVNKRKQLTDAFDRLQLWTGFYLAFFLIVHLSAVMAGRYLWHVDTNLYFGASGLNSYPAKLFFIPYYGSAVLAVFGHIAAVHFRKMKRTVLGVSVRRQAVLILLAGVVTTVVIFYGLTNGFTRLEAPTTHIPAGKQASTLLIGR